VHSIHAKLLPLTESTPSTTWKPLFAYTKNLTEPSSFSWLTHTLPHSNHSIPFGFTRNTRKFRKPSPLSVLWNTVESAKFSNILKMSTNSLLTRRLLVWLHPLLLLPYNWLGTFAVYATNTPIAKPFAATTCVYSAILKWLPWKITNALCVAAFYHMNNTLHSLILYRWKIHKQHKIRWKKNIFFTG